MVVHLQSICEKNRDRKRDVTFFKAPSLSPQPDKKYLSDFKIVVTILSYIRSISAHGSKPKRREAGASALFSQLLYSTKYLFTCQHYLSIKSFIGFSYNV